MKIKQREAEDYSWEEADATNYVFFTNETGRVDLTTFRGLTTIRTWRGRREFAAESDVETPPSRVEAMAHNFARECDKLAKGDGHED